MSAPAVEEAANLVLTLTVRQLKTYLQEHVYTSRQLVELYLDQIGRHNHAGVQLQALISVVARDKALTLADQLDRERREGRTRGTCHGIPIIVEDLINTDPALGMPTTLGTPALLNSMPRQTADVAKKLTDAGFIILGKANMTELGGGKSASAIPGFSPVGGQTQSAYINGGVQPDDTIMGNSNPGGSSGAAAGVAAGFSPFAISNETNGSLITSASRAALYAIKPTAGSVSGKGVLRVTSSFDSVGGMAKSTEDLEWLNYYLMVTATPATALFKREPSTRRPGPRVGFLDPELWRLPPSLLKSTPEYIEQTLAAYQSAMNLIGKNSTEVVYPVEPKEVSQIIDGQSALDVIRKVEFRPLLDEYLKDLGLDPRRTVQHILQFSVDQSDQPVSPIQEVHTKLQSTSIGASMIQTIQMLAGPDNIDQTLKKHDLDLIIGPSDSHLASVADLAGYPVGTMPLGYLKESGRPFGLTLVGAADTEETILGMMGFWEFTSEPRRPPPLLVNWDKKT